MITIGSLFRACGGHRLKRGVAQCVEDGPWAAQTCQGVQFVVALTREFDNGLSGCYYVCRGEAALTLTVSSAEQAEHTEAVQDLTAT